MFNSNRPTNNRPPSSSTPPIRIPVPAPSPDLRAKYQMAPQAANVTKISGLVKGRASASMDEISDIISTDSGVTQRLIKLAYPKQQARLGATVQMATSRLGVNRVIVVMVADLLTKAVIETFETMAGLTLELIDGTAVAMADHGYISGVVRFTGETKGQVTIAFPPHLSLLVTAKLLGGEMGAEEHTPTVINDTVGELVNIVTGSLQSKLSDAGMPSDVGLPEVAFQHSLPVHAENGNSNDLFYFKCGVHTLAVHLMIEPSTTKTGALRAPLRAPPTHGTTWRANGA